MLRASVTNQTSAGCALVAGPEASLQILAASRDGQPLWPTFTRGMFVDGVARAIQRRTTTVAPGATVSFPIDNAAGAGLGVWTPLPDASALIAHWPVAAEGRYELRLLYRVPPLAGAGACAGSTNEVTVAFTVGAESQPPWRLIALAAAALVVAALAVVMLLRVRGHRRRRAATAAVLVLLATLSVTGIDARSAQATLIFPGGDPPDAALFKTYNDCIGKITAVDPQLINDLQDPSFTVTVGPYGRETYRDDHPSGKKRDSLIHWDQTDSSPIPGDPGVSYDPCASLYHELVHAGDAANGQLSQRRCDDLKLLYDEVRATLKENKYRAKYAKEGLKQCTKYDGQKLPPTEDFCNPPKTKPGDRFAGDPGPTCRGINGGCGSSNGDPHMVTFDGYFYDLQAATGRRRCAGTVRSSRHRWVTRPCRGAGR